eukprot:scaffold10_cov257-Pinguiococcus_pyrenoidosus.AAC.12
MSRSASAMVSTAKSSPASFRIRSRMARTCGSSPWTPSDAVKLRLVIAEALYELLGRHGIHQRRRPPHEDSRRPQAVSEFLAVSRSVFHLSPVSSNDCVDLLGRSSHRKDTMLLTLEEGPCIGRSLRRPEGAPPVAITVLELPFVAASIRVCQDAAPVEGVAKKVTRINVTQRTRENSLPAPLAMPVSTSVRAAVLPLPEPFSVNLVLVPFPEVGVSVRAREHSEALAPSAEELPPVNASVVVVHLTNAMAFLVDNLTLVPLLLAKGKPVGPIDVALIKVIVYEVSFPKAARGCEEPTPVFR